MFNARLLVFFPGRSVEVKGTHHPGRPTRHRSRNSPPDRDDDPETTITSATLANGEPAVLSDEEIEHAKVLIEQSYLDHVADRFVEPDDVEPTESEMDEAQNAYERGLFREPF
jgi:hypothetical protein